MIVGAHVSIAGGIENAIINATNLGCETFQIFSKNQNQWREKEYSDHEINKFVTQLSNSNIHSDLTAVHDSYLINLCANDSEKLDKSRNAFLKEINRCTALQIPFLIFHPGSHMGMGEEWGINTICNSLHWVLEKTLESNVVLLLETTAGQGSNLGYKMEHLSKIISDVAEDTRLGICIDTCHIFAAGYDIRNNDNYETTFRQLDDIIGLNHVKAFHLNDSKRDLGSRVDRHEVIGQGFIGELVFKLLMNDKRFEDHPGFLEIPGGDKAFKECLKRLKKFRTQI